MKKKILATSILLVGLSTNANAMTGIPNFDAALNAIMSNQYVQQIKQHAETMIAHAKEMSLEKALAEYQKAQDDARESYKMSAEAQLKVDQYNMENAKDFQTIDTCETTAFAAHVAQGECEAEEYGKNKLDEVTQEPAIKKKALKDLIEQGTPINVAVQAIRQYEDQKTEKLLEFCENTVIDQEYTNDREVIASCTNTRLLAGITAGKTLTDEEIKAAEKAVELMLFSDGDSFNTTMDPRSDVADYRKMAFKNLAASSFYDIIKMHKKLDGGKSIIGALDDLIKSQTATADGIVNSVKINESHTGSSVKYTAEAMRTLLYMQNLQIQQNNKIQALLSAELALQIKGL